VVAGYGLGGLGEEMVAIRLDMPDRAQFWNLIRWKGESDMLHFGAFRQ
jgi:hypothetical protein